MNLLFSTKLRRPLPVLRSLLVLLFSTSFAFGQAVSAEQKVAPQAQGLQPILGYISSAWDTLTRSVTECQSIVDPKIKVSPVLYLPAGFPEPPAVQKLATDCNVRVEHLPREIHHLGEIDTGKIQPHGLLYLENKYVVPGGRFNEMYGWDSYFIIRGLLRTGLSRYYDFGEGPPAEAVQDETGFYRKVATYFFFHPAQADGYILENKPGVTQSVAGAPYTLQVCNAARTMARPDCDQMHEFKLSTGYYKGDRSMRESGFDVSFRFGPFGAATHHYAPVCLNSLLAQTETDMEQISRWLGRSADAAKRNKRAEERNKVIARYLWHHEQRPFFDYNFDTMY